MVENFIRSTENALTCSFLVMHKQDNVIFLQYTYFCLLNLNQQKIGLRRNILFCLYYKKNMYPNSKALEFVNKLGDRSIKTHVNGYNPRVRSNLNISACKR